MARITVSDCLEKVDNRFELVLLASRRARQIMDGAESTLEIENDKPTVVALREIAAGHISVEILDAVDTPAIEDFFVETNTSTELLDDDED